MSGFRFEPDRGHPREPKRIGVGLLIEHVDFVAVPSIDDDDGDRIRVRLFDLDAILFESRRSPFSSANSGLRWACRWRKKSPRQRSRSIIAPFAGAAAARNRGNKTEQANR
jgi:hypothetical protein